MSTKKLTPQQLQTVELIKKELFPNVSNTELNSVLDSLFTYIYLSDDFEACERMQFLFAFKGFKRLATLMETGEITNEVLQIKV